MRSRPVPARRLPRLTSVGQQHFQADRGVGRVAHVDVVAGLLAIAEDLDRRRSSIYRLDLAKGITSALIAMRHDAPELRDPLRDEIGRALQRAYR